jgi:hypothetical protein
MSALFSDTHPKMEALQIQLLRQATPARKMELLGQLNASVHILALTGLRSRYHKPMKLNFAAGWQACPWGKRWRAKFTVKSTMLPEPLAVTLKVTDGLEKLG